MIVIAIIAAHRRGRRRRRVFSNFKKAQVQDGKLRVTEVRSAVTQYMIDNNTCPQGMEDLIAQKYLDKKAPRTPGARTFTFECPGRTTPRARTLLVRPRQARRHRRRHQVLGVDAR